jgi:hypothetical protein
MAWSKVKPPHVCDPLPVIRPYCSDYEVGVVIRCDGCGKQWKLVPASDPGHDVQAGDPPRVPYWQLEQW